MRSADFSEIQRKDVWSIPLLILREAVINALVHADYSLQGSPIRIAFFDDRIEIENPGILVPGMTVDAMKRGVSKLRNRAIACVFRELNLIEQWGSGVSRIFREAEKQGLAEPLIEEIGIHLRVTILLTNRISTGQWVVESKIRPYEKHEAGLESKLESALAARVIMQLQDRSLGKAEIAKLLGHKSVSGALNSQIRNLLAQQIIEMTLPDKPNSRLQKYRISAQGHSFITELLRT